jgi:HK97 family phage prohead protease
VDAELFRIGVGGVVPVRWEAEKSDAGSGTLTGWASVYNVVDQQDDVVIPGAFSKTLSDWRASKSKRVIGLTLDHQNDSDGLIGALADAQDSSYGLKTTFRFSATAKAQEARVKAREGILNGLSFFGPIYDKAFADIAGKSVQVLKECGLWFVGMTPMPANTDAVVLAAKESVSNTPWSNFSPADYTIEQYRRACLIGPSTPSDSKDDYHLPVREPSGVLNRNGVHAAAGRINQVQGGGKEAAAKKLVSLYRNQLKEDPPENLLRMAGMASASLPEDWVGDMKSALSITVPTVRKAAVDLLVASRYQVSDVGSEAFIPRTGEPGDVPDDQGGELDAAAKYALSIIGESGPDISPPGGEPSDSLAGLFASLDAEKTKSELDGLEAELRGES